MDDEVVDVGVGGFLTALKVSRFGSECEIRVTGMCVCVPTCVSVSECGRGGYEW